MGRLLEIPVYCEGRPATAVLVSATRGRCLACGALMPVALVGRGLARRTAAAVRRPLVRRPA